MEVRKLQDKTNTGAYKSLNSLSSNAGCLVRDTALHTQKKPVHLEYITVRFDALWSRLLVDSKKVA